MSFFPFFFFTNMRIIHFQCPWRAGPNLSVSLGQRFQNLRSLDRVWPLPQVLCSKSCHVKTSHVNKKSIRCPRLPEANKSWWQACPDSLSWSWSWLVERDLLYLVRFWPQCLQEWNCAWFCSIFGAPEAVVSIPLSISSKTNQTCTVFVSIYVQNTSPHFEKHQGEKMADLWGGEDGWESEPLGHQVLWMLLLLVCYWE